MEEEKSQEFDASMEERVEETECLSLKDVVRLTQAKAEVRSYPWYSVRKMAREIVVGTKKENTFMHRMPNRNHFKGEENTK